MTNEQNIWISLLRGVNVGGHNKIAKEQLITVYVSLGFENVRTHIQSGNVLFSSPANDSSKLAAEIEAALENQLGCRLSAILRTPKELLRTIAANPFPAESEANPAKVLVGFFNHAPSQNAIQQMKPLACEPDRYCILGREVFCHYPDGSGRSKLNINYFEKQLGVTATARNWRVVNKLLELAERG